MRRHRLVTAHYVMPCLIKIRASTEDAACAFPYISEENSQIINQGIK
jgi:hypothetical protein